MKRYLVETAIKMGVFLLLVSCATAKIKDDEPRNNDTGTTTGESGETDTHSDTQTGDTETETESDNTDPGTGSDMGTGSDAGTGSNMGTGSDAGTGSDMGTGNDTGTGNNTGSEPDTGTGDACEADIATYVYDFETGQNGWSHGVLDGASHSFWELDPWEYGVATSTGPASCHRGAGSCFATDLDDNYLYCQRAFLESPQLDLSKCQETSLKLVFYHYYDFWDNGSESYDGGIVEFSRDGGATWTVPTTVSYPGTVAIYKTLGSLTCILSDSFHVDNKPGYTLANDGWGRVEIPIPDDMKNGSFAVRFAFSSGLSWETQDMSESRMHTAPGWYIDDVSIEAQ